MEVLAPNYPSTQSFPLLSEYYLEHPHEIPLDVCGGMCVFLYICVYVYILYIFIYIYMFIHERR